MHPDADILRALDLYRSLPVPAPLWHRIAAVPVSGRDRIARLARIVARDPLLTVEFLEALGRPVLGHPGPQEILETVQVCGTAAARDLLLEILVKDSVFRWSLPGSGLDPATWWRHSLGTAAAAVRVAARVRGASARSCHEAALLHDAGVLAVDRLAPQVLCAAGVGAEPTRDDDIRVLDASHHELGRRMAEPWRLGERSLSAILHHHHPMSAPPEHRTVACVVCVADTLMSPEDEWWYGGGPEEEYRNALAYLGLDEPALDDIRASVQVDLVRFGTVLNVPTRH